MPAHVLVVATVTATSDDLMAALARAGVDLDRKVLADMAVNDPPAFKKLAELVPAAAGK